MLPVHSSKESRSFDDFLIKKIGIPSAVLIENAARGALDAMKIWLDELGKKSVILFCGKGNNGGDGFALARLLHERSVDVYVMALGKPTELSKDASLQFSILKKLLPEGRIHNYPLRDSHFLTHIQVGIIVDALLGTGATGALKGKYKEAVLDINAFADHFDADVLSLDVPTGLNTDTGATATLEDGEPVVVIANKTVAMGSLKQGFFLQHAPDIVGEVSIAELGATAVDWKSPEKNTVFLIDEGDAQSSFFPRSLVSSKFDYGHVLSISGSKGMTGAAVMAGISSLRIGAGLVSIATPESQRSIIASSIPEAMTFGISEDGLGQPTSNAYAELTHLLLKATVVHFGSGILLTDETRQLTIELLKNVEQPLVLDAGALIGLAKHHDLFRKRKGDTVITPHLGEMAQLLGITREKLEADKIGIARDFAMKNNTVVILKGAPTIFASPDGTVFLNATGNPGMATAGSGDVLAGIISGAIAQKPHEVLEAVMFAVYVHGLAGDIAAEKITEQAMIATDIIRALPKALKKLELK